VSQRRGRSWNQVREPAGWEAEELMSMDQWQPQNWQTVRKLAIPWIVAACLGMTSCAGWFWWLLDRRHR